MSDRIADMTDADLTDSIARLCRIALTTDSPLEEALTMSVARDLTAELERRRKATPLKVIKGGKR